MSELERNAVAAAARRDGPLRVCLTVDVEQDCPPFRTTYRGMEEGLPKLTALLADLNVPATFFTTGDVAARFPHAVQALTTAGHELGCHGDTHRRFDEMDEADARLELTAATRRLRTFAEVTSFRAPNLAFPNRYLKLLEALNYQLDSSVGKHKLAYWRRSSPTELHRVPASTTSSVLRYPAFVRNALFSILRDPVVLFVHPWEFVDWRASDLRWDCRFRTGDMALDCLASTLSFFRGRGARFVRMCDLESANRKRAG